MKSTTELQDTLAGLRHKLSGARERLAEVDELIRGCAVAAHSGDDAARRKLDKLSGDKAKWSAEIASLTIATSDVEQRIATHDREVAAATAREAARAKVRMAREIAARAVKHGAEMEKALRSFSSNATAFLDSLDELRRMDAPAASGRLAELAVVRSINATLFAAGFREFRPQLSGQAHDLATLTADYLAPVEQWADALERGATPAKVNAEAA